MRRMVNEKPTLTTADVNPYGWRSGLDR